MAPFFKDNCSYTFFNRDPDFFKYKYSMIKSLLFILLIGQAPVDSVHFLSPADIINQAAELEINNEYDKAIELYLKVSENDTSFVQVQSSLMSAYNSAKQYDNTIAIGSKLKDVFSSYRKDIYIDLGNAYLNGSNYEMARDIYAEGVQLFPYNYIFLYNLGLAHRKCGDYKEAITCFQRSASINPFYSNNHMMLGYISMLQGHTTKAMLSYLTFLAINPDNNSILIFLDNLVAEAVRKEGSIEPCTDNGEFRHFDELLHSRAAFDDRFKLSVDFNANIVKQSELLFSKLKYDSTSQDFWMQQYVPFYTQLVKQNLHNAFIYFILKSTNNEEVLAWIEKHEKEKTAWIDVANKKLVKKRLKNKRKLLGEQRIYSHWYYENNTLNSIGNKIDEETRIGPWAFYYQNSQLSNTGKFNQKGQKVGEWLYYHENGRLSRRELYNENGVISEPTNYYHDNGALSIVANYNDAGQLDGPLEYCFSCGQIRESFPFVAEVKNGSGHHYYRTGQVKADYLLKEGSLEGEYINYFNNGQIESKYNYINALTTGPYQSFYIDGQLEEEGSYKDDSLSGAWAGYHPNSVLKYKGSMARGNRTGRWEFYHSNGNIKEIIHYNDSGEKHGENQNYTYQGKLQSVITYDQESIIALKFVDQQEHVLYEVRNPEGNMAYETYYPTGELLAKGTLKEGKLNGPLTTYFKNGSTEMTVNTVNDTYDGLYEEFYSTGGLYIKCSYENGMKNGRYLQFYKNGQINYDGWYINDKVEQSWITYHPDGSLDEDNYYIADQNHGWNHIYAPGDKLHLSYKYDIGLLVGLRQYDTLGNIYHELELPHGNGMQARKTVSGDTIFKVNMQCGQFVSNLYSYYANGNIEDVNLITDGLLEGTYESRHLDGSVAIKGVYKNNKQEGQWQWYHSNGNVSTERFYKRGLAEGSSKVYYSHGQMESEFFYREDELDGACQYFDHLGNHQLTKIYNKDDGLITYVDVKSQDTIQFNPKGKFTLQSYFDNGQLAVSQSYLNGKYDGVCTWYNIDGSVVEKINYIMGDYHGRRIKYHPNGKIFRETSYRFDEKHGLERAYYESGQIHRETPYINDNINGYEVIYNRDGSVKSKIYYWNDEVY